VELVVAEVADVLQVARRRVIDVGRRLFFVRFFAVLPAVNRKRLLSIPAGILPPDVVVISGRRARLVPRACRYLAVDVTEVPGVRVLPGLGEVVVVKPAVVEEVGGAELSGGNCRRRRRQVGHGGSLGR